MRISDWSSDVCSSDLILLLLKQSIDGDRGNCIGFAGLLHARPQQDRSVLNYGEHGMVGDSTAIRLRGSRRRQATRSEEHTSELQSLMRISYAVFCWKKKKHTICATSHHLNTTLQS